MRGAVERRCQGCPDSPDDHVTIFRCCFEDKRERLPLESFVPVTAMSLVLQAIHHESSASDPISLPEGARTFRVGRLEDNDVQINHSSISAKHALLKGSATNGVELIDCDSSNGTFVNGVRIDRQELHEGDVVKFAYLAYQVVTEGETPAVLTAPVNLLAAGSGESKSKKQEDSGESVSPKADQEQEIESLDADHRMVLEELEALKRTIASQSDEIEELHSESQEKSEKLAQSEAVVKEGKNALQELERQHRQLSEQLQRKETEFESEQLAARNEQQKAEAELEAEKKELSDQKEGLAEDYASAKEEIASLRDQLESERSQYELAREAAAAEKSRLETHLESEKKAFKARLAEEKSTNEQLASSLESEIAQKEEAQLQLSTRIRELGDLNGRLEKASSDLKGRSAEVLEREQVIATVQFEKDGVARELADTQKTVESLEADCFQWRDAYENLKSTLEGTTVELEQTREGRNFLQERLDFFVIEFRKYLAQLSKDWEFWQMEGGLADASEVDSLEECFSQAEALRVSIREELDEVEPVWKEHGKRVSEELKTQILELEGELSALDNARVEKTSEVEALTSDAKMLREEVDVEVRRAQGLSRRGVQIEIPERFESMVIAQDRERQILLSLVGSLEFLDQLISGYRRSKKLREVVYELEEFAKRIVRILESNGVKEFTLEPGTELTLKHRKEVQIVEKKGWGTRDFVEQPFHPGKVQKVIRSGYRAGEGEGAVLLRKVEVLIRETEG